LNFLKWKPRHFSWIAEGSHLTQRKPQVCADESSPKQWSGLITSQAHTKDDSSKMQEATCGDSIKSTKQKIE